MSPGAALLMAVCKADKELTVIVAPHDVTIPAKQKATNSKPLLKHCLLPVEIQKIAFLVIVTVLMDK